LNSIAIIPARLSSSRLPRKVLADIHGHPLIWHVWKRVKQAKKIDQIFIATDSEEVKVITTSFGAQVIMTSPDCQSGTERIASILDQVDGDLILNVQGDEPLVDPEMLDALVERWSTVPCELITPVFKINKFEDLQSPNVVKVARASDGRAIYFSRNPIPYLRDFPFEFWLENGTFWGHIGVYGYSREILSQYNKFPISPLENMERLEQLRFLEAGYSFQTVETDYRPNAVDVIEDLERIRHILSQPGNQ
jgi:3-deoxy-manno-octulosonate cytidylyltransferase (CMP-KDO synthetase)